jgi:hypothetical protein
VNGGSHLEFHTCHRREFALKVGENYRPFIAPPSNTGGVHIVDPVTQRVMSGEKRVVVEAELKTNPRLARRMRIFSQAMTERIITIHDCVADSIIQFQSRLMWVEAISKPIPFFDLKKYAPMLRVLMLNNIDISYSDIKMMCRGRKMQITSLGE